MSATGRHVLRLSSYAPALPTPFDDAANSISLRLNVSVIVRSRAGQPRWWCVERRVKLPP